MKPPERFIYFHIRLLVCIAVTTSGALTWAHDRHEQPVMCSYYGQPIASEIKMGPPDPQAVTVIENILSVVGLRPNFEIRSADVPNAAAVIFKNQRYILYNPKFLSRINYASGTNWAGISILAHEIGHHLNGHTLQKSGSRPALELEADAFSGFVLNKLGADRNDAQAAMNVAASQKSSHTHPARKDRLVAISDGWHQANAQLKTPTKQQNAASVKSRSRTGENAMVEIPGKSEPAIDEKHLAFHVYFNADRNGRYFITTKGNLVNIANDSVYLIGRLAESNRPGYKLMLSDQHSNLYIAAKGQILNGHGQSVGYIDSYR